MVGPFLVETSHEEDKVEPLCGGSVSNTDGCLAIGVALQMSFCGSIRKADWDLHKCTENGRACQPDKVMSTASGQMPMEWQDQASWA